jgi:hypothetical protein
MAEHIVLGYSTIGKDDRGNEKIFRKIFLDKNKDGPLIGADIELAFDETTANFVSSSDAHIPSEMRQDYGDINSQFDGYD